MSVVASANPTDMAWIETIPPGSPDVGEALARAYAMQRTLYPAMYGEP